MRKLILLAFVIFTFASIASAGNLTYPLTYPPCCGGLSSGATSYPSAAFSYQGVQPVPGYCCSQDLAVNPDVPYTFEFTYWPYYGYDGEYTWYAKVEGPEYSFDPDDPTSAILSTEGLAFGNWYNAVYDDGSQFTVAAGNQIVATHSMDSSAAPEAGSAYMILIGIFCLTAAKLVGRWIPPQPL